MGIILLRVMSLEYIHIYPWPVNLIIAFSTNVSALLFMHIFFRQFVAAKKSRIFCLNNSIPILIVSPAPFHGAFDASLMKRFPVRSKHLLQGVDTFLAFKKK